MQKRWYHENFREQDAQQIVNTVRELSGELTKLKMKFKDSDEDTPCTKQPIRDAPQSIWKTTIVQKRARYLDRDTFAVFCERLMVKIVITIYIKC